MIERGKSSLSERNRKCPVKKFNSNPGWLNGEDVPMMLPGAEYTFRRPEIPAFVPAHFPYYDLGRAPSLLELFDHTGGGKHSRNFKRGKGRPSSEDKPYAPAGKYVAVRYIRRGKKKDCVMLASENPDFADTEVELSKIGAIAFVKASIHANSSK